MFYSEAVWSEGFAELHNRVCSASLTSHPAAGHMTSGVSDREAERGRGKQRERAREGREQA